MKLKQLPETTAFPILIQFDKDNIFAELHNQCLSKKAILELAEKINIIVNNNPNYNKWITSLEKDSEQQEVRCKTKIIDSKEMGYIYLIQDGENTKIGRAKNVENRFKTINTSTSSQIELIFSCRVKNYIYAENKLHEWFKDKRIKGEWFNLDNKDINFIKSKLYSIQVI